MTSHLGAAVLRAGLLAAMTLLTLPAVSASLDLVGNWSLQDSAKVSEGGAAISQPGYRPDHWYKATVPGTVLTSLVNDGVYPAPLYGLNNLTIPDSLCRTSYWYRTPFTVPAADSGRQVWLRFDGINYVAEVWVNGHDVGPIKGAFARGLFNITSYIKSGDANALAVQVLPQPDPGVSHQKTQASGTGRNGGVSAADGPTFLCTIGWDWIPTIRDRDTGIWQNVSLSDSGFVTIHDIDVTSTLPLPKLYPADLTVQATLQNTSPHTVAGTLVGAFGNTVFRVPVSIGPSSSRALTLTPEQVPGLHVLHPLLWWPNGYGRPNLYHLQLKFVTAQGISDQTDTEFGIRKITYFVPGSENLTLSVNGVPILCKGGDWGMDEAMKRIPPARLDAEVRMHQEANYTIIRNWVGQSTSEAFYNACDKYGILVWDEFFQPNPGDGPNPNDTSLYLNNVREKVLRFRSHPCIALWCARNEGNPPPIIGQGIQAILAQYDPGRLYQPSSTSGHGVHSSGPYYWRSPQDFYVIDAPFKTEIGSVSIPTLESIEAMMPSKDWGSINEDWAEHDLCAGAQAGNQYPYEMAARYGPVASLADFARKGQLMNYEAFRAMYEGREVALFHPTTGVITWMSDPAQPSFVWQIYSWDLEPNSSLFAVREACEPIHIMMNQTNNHLVVINNTPHTLANAKASVAVYNLDGTLMYSHAETLTAAPSAATDNGLIALPQGVSSVYFVKLDLRNAQGSLLSDNFYWQADAASPDNMQALNSLPMVTLDAHVDRHDSGAKVQLLVTLRNPSKAVALMAHLQLRRAGTTMRVLPVFYSDNYISLVPGESRTVTVEAAKADLDGHAPQIVVDGWNVTVRPSVGVAPNTDALVSMPVKPIAAAVQTGPIKINCGGNGTGFFTFGAQPTGEFTADIDYVGGRTKTVTDRIAVGVPNAAPEDVYKSERWGPCVYTIPVSATLATPGTPVTVRLHFAETTFTAVGAREFNVDINGKQVLTNFDVYAAAGGADKAVVRDFTASPDAQGNIVISLAIGAVDQPKISGIEILAQ